MPWSRVTSGIRERLAPSLRGRIDLRRARYRYTLEEMGRVWLELDGREVIQFDTISYEVRRHEVAEALRAATGPAGPSHVVGTPEYYAADDAAIDELRRAGRYDDYSAVADLQLYLSLAIEEALRAPSPLVRALAVVDRRVGKRRLRTLAHTMAGEHPLVQELFRVRCAAEGVSVADENGAPGEGLP